MKNMPSTSSTISMDLVKSGKIRKIWNYFSLHGKYRQIKHLSKIRGKSRNFTFWQNSTNTIDMKLQQPCLKNSNQIIIMKETLVKILHEHLCHNDCVELFVYSCGNDCSVPTGFWLYITFVVYHYAIYE